MSNLKGSGMRELPNESEFTSVHTSHGLTLIPNGETLSLQQLTPEGWVTVGDTYDTNRTLEIKTRSDVKWRVSGSNGGATAKVYIYKIESV